MKFIVNYPEMKGSSGDLLDSGPVGDLARAAEKAGFFAFSLTEHPIPSARWLDTGGHQTIDPLVGLAFAASATTSIRLLTYLSVLPYRNPFVLAKAAATLDRLSGGRLILGAGTGYQKAEFHALGVDMSERNALFDEALDVLPLAWRGEPFSYHGLHFDARDVIARPRPSQNPIPIWIGGNATVTLQRVAARAQGWMPLSGPPELARTARTAHLATLEDLRTKIADLGRYAGDRLPGLEIAFPYKDRTAHDPTIDIERHRDTIGELEAAGVTGLTIEAPDGRERALEFVRSFGETYIEKGTS